MRRRPGLAAALLVAVLPLAGCAGGGGAGGGGGGAGTGSGSGAGDAPAPLPAPQHVELVRTGGIAGSTETVSVDPRGGWRHTAGRTAPTTGTLTAAQLDRLTRLAADPELDREATRPPGSAGCADGYAVSLTVGRTTVRWQECDPGRDRPPVSAQIARLLAESTD